MIQIKYQSQSLILRHLLWPPHAKSWLIGKDSDAGRDWGQEEKGMTEDEMAGWHHWLNGHESEWTLRVGDRQGGLVCCDSWGCKESDTTEQLNWTDLLSYTFQTKEWDVVNHVFIGIQKALQESHQKLNMYQYYFCSLVKFYIISMVLSPAPVPCGQFQGIQFVS